MARRDRPSRQLLAWGAFGLLSLVAIAFEGAYVFNATQWFSAPHRGWIYSVSGDPHVVVETYDTAEAAGLIERDNQVLEIPTAEMGVMATLHHVGGPLLAGLIFVATGILVFLMKPREGPSWGFLLVALVMGVCYPYLWLGPSYAPAWLEGVFVPAGYLGAAAILQLTAFFPQRRAFFADRWFLLALPYGIAVVLSVLELSGDYRTPGALGSLRGTMLIGSILVFMASATQAWLRGRSQASRIQAIAVLTGSLLTAFVPTADNLYTSIVGVRLLPLSALPAFLFAFPIAVGYAIVQHDLFEIDTIVRRTYGYILTTSVVLTLYGGTISGLNLIIGPTDLTSSPLFAVVFILAMVFVMQPIHARIQRFVDRVFYRQKYDYRTTITALTERITSLLDPRAVRETLVGSVVSEMFLENGMLLATANGPDVLELQVDVEKQWAAGRPAEIQLAKPVVEAIQGRRAPLFRHEIELDPAFQGRREDMAACFDSLEAEMIMPMFYQDDLRAVLSLGRKKSGKMFTREDVDLLRTLSGEASIALENSRLFKDLADSLKQVQMLETVKSNLAKFVPETVKSMVENGEDAEDLFQKRDHDLSVMFADMTGYTRLSAQLPIEEVNEIIERYFGAFLDEILRHGGDVNETAGDGLMVLFQDDDPQQHARAAVSAALGIQRLTREINAERETEGGGPVGMHIGINSGTASVGATKISGGAGMRWTYTASGPITNISARIGALGEDIAITTETWERLGEGFQVEEVGPQSLKNVAEPVMVYRVLAGELEAAAHHAAPDAEPSRDEVIERVWEEVQVLGRGRFAIRGFLRAREDGAPLSGLRVHAFDKDWIRDDYLGRATSASDGSFEIVFTDEFFGDLFEAKPDLYVVVKDADDRREIYHTRDSVRWNARAVEHYELHIPRRCIEDSSEPPPVLA
jgi:class 3 adenylate cyclase